MVVIDTLFILTLGWLAHGLMSDHMENTMVVVPDEIEEAFVVVDIVSRVMLLLSLLIASRFIAFLDSVLV